MHNDRDKELVVRRSTQAAVTNSQLYDSTVATVAVAVAVTATCCTSSDSDRNNNTTAVTAAG